MKKSKDTNRINGVGILSVGQVALEYREQGISCIPCEADSKATRVRWQKFQNKLIEATEVEELFKGHSGNIAAILGQASGNLVCLDCEDKGLYNEWKQEVEGLTGGTWCVSSHRGGHIYLRTPQPVRSRKHLEADYEIRGSKSYVMLPPSIHPNKTRYEFESKPPQIAVVSSLPFCQLEFVQAEEDDDEEVLAVPVLRRQAGTILGVEECLQVLEDIVARRPNQYADRNTGVIDRSRFDMAAIQTLVNKGVDRETIRQALADTRQDTHYSRLFREQGKRRADQNFEFSYEKALRQPDTEKYQANEKLADKAALIVTTMSWKGHGSLGERTAMLTHIGVFGHCKKDVWNLSERRGGELGGMSHLRFCRCTKRLIEKRGYLVRVKIGKGEEANSYRFSTGFLSLLQNVPHTQINSPVCIWNNKQLMEVEDYGVFERKGLGDASKIIYYCLLQNEKLKKSEIANKTGTHRSTISRKMPDLLKHDLVKQDGKYFYSVRDFDFKPLSRELGVDRIAEDRKRLHEEERRIAREKRPYWLQRQRSSGKGQEGKS